MKIGIDVGNTAIKFARDGGGPSESEIVSTRLRDPDAIEAVVERLIHWQRRDRESLDVRIASVNRGVASDLIESLGSRLGASVVIRTITPDDIPMTVLTDDPNRVGIDRIVGAYGASIGCACPLVIVDAGTTVTVDWVDAQAAYRGGAIIPGLEMQTAALAAGTDLLPSIDWQSHANDTHANGSVINSVPGTNTIAAMRLGILSSVVGGIERLRRLYGHPLTTVFTGGDAETIAAAMPGESVYVDRNLICRTLISLE